MQVNKITQPPGMMSETLQEFNQEQYMLNEQANTLTQPTNNLRPSYEMLTQSTNLLSLHQTNMMWQDDTEHPSQNRITMDEPVSVNSGSHDKETMVLQTEPCDNESSVLPDQKPTQQTPKQICPICGKPMINNSQLVEHLSNVHTDVKKFLCLYCQKRFKSR